eukprot:Amastigsp_a678740_66.p2 type:complete len:126 gc:universal Amastigsp_a678740_66:1166-789(-)
MVHLLNIPPPLGAASPSASPPSGSGSTEPRTRVAASSTASPRLGKAGASSSAAALVLFASTRGSATTTPRAVYKSGVSGCSSSGNVRAASTASTSCARRRRLTWISGGAMSAFEATTTLATYGHA